MSVSSALLRHNPRVVDASLSATADWDPAQAPGLSPGAVHLSLHLEHLSADEAALLCRHADLVGGSAESRMCPAAPSPATCAALVSATEGQFERLLATLQRLAPELAEALRQTIEQYLRRRWIVPCGTHQLELGPQPLLMGIVNVTPDSFSDGGTFLSAKAAIEHGEQLLQAGAAILDVGGESTRPGAAEVSVEEELSRVLPVVSELAGRQGALVSIDTRKPAVAEAALAAGAAIVNDITALADPAMARLVARGGCGAILMHMQGEPRTMQQNPQYAEVVSDVTRSLRQSLAAAERAGVDLQRTISDPGIGFGKTLEHNLSLLRRLRELRSLGRPLLVGPSRKRFIGMLTGDAPADERLSGTIAACVWSRQCGADIMRVHDVREVARAMAVTAGIER